MDKLKVLIADDILVSRKVFSEAAENTGLGTVIHTASNGNIALEWLRQCAIDVLLLDVHMPEKDGIETLKIVRNEFPEVAVIMISTGGINNAEITIEALKYGAIDFILKPNGQTYDKNMEKVKNQLQVLFTQIKIKKCNETNLKKDLNQSEKLSQPTIRQDCFNEMKEKVNQKKWSGADLVLIASSTGGPSALERIFSKLKPELKKPVLIVQHMPPDFTRVLAQTLSNKYHFNVIEGFDGCKVKDGQIVIAPGGLHMTVEMAANSEGIIRLLGTPYVNGVRPAADVLFQSVAKAYSGKNILIVVLTGMGSDGMNGIIELRNKCNCFCITQSESTCVVYGMPRSVFDAGLSDEVDDLDNISARIYQLATGRG